MTNKTRKTGTNFDLTTGFLIEKQPISTKIKTRFSQLISKILLKQ